jgi:hypothetical protein
VCPVAKIEKPNNDGLVSGSPVVKGVAGDESMRPTQEPPLSPWQARDLACWYQEEGEKRRQGLDLDQAGLDTDLRHRLAGEVSAECIDAAFEQIMAAVFAGPDVPVAKCEKSANHGLGSTISRRDGFSGDRLNYVPRKTEVGRPSLLRPVGRGA